MRAVCFDQKGGPDVKESETETEAVRVADRDRVTVQVQVTFEEFIVK